MGFKKLFIRFILIGLFYFPYMINASTNYELVSDIGTSAKMISVGNMEGFQKSASSVFHNPAALNYIDKYAASLFTTTFLNEVKYSAYAFSAKTNMGTVGVGYISKAISGIPHTTIDEQSDDKRFIPEYFFEFSSSIFSLSYQNTANTFYKLSRLDKYFGEKPFFNDISMGVSLKQYGQSIDKISGAAMNFDSGILYQRNNLGISAVLRNFVPGRNVSYSNGGIEKLPGALLIEGHYDWNALDLYAQFKRTSGKMMLGLGGTYTPSLLQYVDVSMGFKPYLLIDEVKYNLTFGFGINLNSLSFHYAMESSDHLLFKNKHYFSVAINY